MRRFLNILIQFGEFIGVLSIVFIFFIIFIGLLNMLFPSGTGFREILSSQRLLGLYNDQSEQESTVLLDNKGLTASLNEAAVLTKIKNSVKSKRADEIVWSSAQEGMQIFNRDAIQTLKEGYVQIKIDRNSYLELGQNSIVVIRNLEEDIFVKEKRSILVMVDGEIRGKISGAEDKPYHVEIKTPSAVTRISAKQTRGDADFTVRINPDKSSTIAVLKGSAEVIAQGQKVQVAANQITDVYLNKSPSSPKPLPPPAVLISPPGKSIYYYNMLPPRIKFRWDSTSNNNTYKFLVAKDPDFREIIMDEVVTTNSFTHGNLKQGNYFWRVDIPYGIAGETRQIQLLQDSEPPLLHVESPPRIVYDERYLLKGVTESGTQIFIENHPITITESGGFEYSLKLDRGTNVIIVEAVDKIGNVSYFSTLMDAKF